MSSVKAVLFSHMSAATLPFSLPMQPSVLAFGVHLVWLKMGTLGPLLEQMRLLMRRRNSLMTGMQSMCQKVAVFLTCSHCRSTFLSFTIQSKHAACTGDLDLLQLSIATFQLS